jgi:hypothetical protein
MLAFIFTTQFYKLTYAKVCGSVALMQIETVQFSVNT